LVGPQENPPMLESVGRPSVLMKIDDKGVYGVPFDMEPPAPSYSVNLG